MSDKEGTVEIKVKADVEALKSAMEKAADAVKDAVEKIKKSFEEMEKAIKKACQAMHDCEPKFKQRLHAMKEKVGETSTEAKGHFAKLGEEIEKVGETFGKLTKVPETLNKLVEGAKKLKEFADESAKLHKEAGELAEKLEITATKASVLNVALRDAEVTNDKFVSAAKMTKEKLEQNEAAFKKFGIVTRDGNGELRDGASVLMEVNAKLLEYKEGADRDAEAALLFGKSWEQAKETVHLTTKEFEEARQKADDLNLTVSQEGKESAEHYSKAMKDVSDMLLGLKNTIGEAVMPVITQLAEWFSSIGPAAIFVVKGAIGGLVAVFQGLIVVVNIVADVLGGIWETITLSWNNIDVSGAWSKVGDKIFKDAEKTRNDLYNLFANPTPISEEKTGKTSTHKKEEGKEKEGEKGGEKGEGAKHSGGKAKHAKEDAGEKQQLREAEIAQVRKMDEVELGMAADKYKHMKEMGELNQEAELEVTKTLAERKYEIEKKALDDRLALRKQEPAAAHKIKDELAALELKHTQEIARINDQAETARKKAAEKALAEQKKMYEQMMAPVEQSITKSVQGMIQGTMTAQQALRNLNQAILNEFISMIVKRTTQWVVGELTQMAATRAAATANMATKSAEATASVGANAASAAAGAASSQAAIPFAGPGLAAAAFATTMALVLGARSMIHSAAGGYDIPGGVNPLTQLHQKEMVLPAHIAEPLRNNLANGGGGGHTINYHDYSGQLTPGEIQRNVGVIARALKGYGRQFAL